MKIFLPELSTDRQSFPPTHQALDNPDGLIAMGGDLHPDRLMSAYRQGIFPWYSHNEPILWWSPSIRAIFDPKTFKPAKSLKKYFRKSGYTVTINRATERVITLCAETRSPEETWLVEEMGDAYKRLASLGHVHSVEVWLKDQIVGGLYGVEIGQVFCGESMFSIQPNASKIALWHFCHHFQQNGGVLIDCQLMNAHLQSLGAMECNRANFLDKLKNLNSRRVSQQCYRPQILESPISGELL
ncbi:leucyl/phenylalanyl-tRNA--protein transferase [Vibrio nigripulchritudo ATCC 27043]|uniref:leucyl/phenylalanyl-tRNA--protein transferase n=1 Tax=Vibrio nigripulchritudo TaxID=28173 RepID=UPI00021C1C2B|nr:leucyl/phenylalanyl-tRNA--protein transferase [Vibrio nigripulchritudo]EGU55661.1 leucyl/phenylalanyl-tRNA--protein transferase [Vibrio nigripulchritudo ATCC 27043]